MMISTTATVDVSIAQMAEWFGRLSQDEMATFLSLVGTTAPRHRVAGGHSMAWYVGHHLATCPCATDAGRGFVREIAAAMETTLAGARA